VHLSPLPLAAFAVSSRQVRRAFHKRVNKLEAEIKHEVLYELEDSDLTGVSRTQCDNNQ
jgi:hypothetical protein